MLVVKTAIGLHASSRIGERPRLARLRDEIVTGVWPRPGKLVGGAVSQSDRGRVFAGLRVSIIPAIQVTAIFGITVGPGVSRAGKHDLPRRGSPSDMAIEGLPPNGAR